MKFYSITELEQFLISRYINVSCWGKGFAKDIKSLWNELAEGEIEILNESMIIRVVSVVVVIIRQNNNILIEFQQELLDGRVRLRNHPPSEKIKLKETYVDAASRCIIEELHSSKEDIKIITSTYKQITKQNDSASYPGLNTKYIIHQVEASVKNLPNIDFITQELPGDKIVNKHYWVWVPEKQVLNIIY